MAVFRPGLLSHRRTDDLSECTFEMTSFTLADRKVPKGVEGVLQICQRKVGIGQEGKTHVGRSFIFGRLILDFVSQVN